MQLDEDRALEILEDECQRATDDSWPVRWQDRIQRLCALAEASSETYIAAFGTQALAKATDLRAYTLSKDVGDKEGGYSARGFCKRVLAAEAPRLGIDLGVTGREPLNNQPFFWVTYMDEARDRVKGDAQEAYDLLIEMLRDLNKVQDREEARQILRAFLQLRLKEEREAPDVEAEGITDAEFSEMASRFVEAKSEGGRRAQAMAAAIFDAAFGSECVVTERVNDPDRHLVGDVGVFQNPDDETPLIATEVRDKPVESSDVYHFIKKVGREGVHRACIIAVSQKQDRSLIDEMRPPSDIRDFASSRGVRVRVFLGWERIVGNLIYWAGIDPLKFTRQAYQMVFQRAIDLEVSEEGVSLWRDYAISNNYDFYNGA